MGDDEVGLGADQIGRHRGKPLIAPFQPAVIDGDGRSLDVTKVAQALAKALKARCNSRSRRGAQETNARHLARFLRACGKRPSRYPTDKTKKRRRLMSVPRAQDE
jgi:hypothetical protein